MAIHLTFKHLLGIILLVIVFAVIAMFIFVPQAQAIFEKGIAGLQPPVQEEPEEVEGFSFSNICNVQIPSDIPASEKVGEFFKQFCLEEYRKYDIDVNVNEKKRIYNAFIFDLGETLNKDEIINAINSGLRSWAFIKQGPMSELDNSISYDNACWKDEFNNELSNTYIIKYNKDQFSADKKIKIRVGWYQEEQRNLVGTVQTGRCDQGYLGEECGSRFGHIHCCIRDHVCGVKATNDDNGHCCPKAYPFYDASKSKCYKKFNVIWPLVTVCGE